MRLFADDAAQSLTFSPLIEKPFPAPRPKSERLTERDLAALRRNGREAVQRFSKRWRDAQPCNRLLRRRLLLLLAAELAA